MQELKFHLQDIHCVELRKGCKRSSPESEVDTRPRKIKSPGDASRPNLNIESEAYIKQEYKFVDEAAKLWSRETSRESTSPSISSKGSTPLLDWNADSAQSGSETPPSSTYSDGLDKIDPSLRAGATPPSIGSSLLSPDYYATVVSTHDASEIVDLTTLDSETTYHLGSEGYPKDTITTQGTSQTQ